MHRERTRARVDGFTLIEVLAGFAIAAVIILASATLIHNVAGHFDRGARNVNDAERLLLAIDRLAQDFASARFVLRATEKGPAVAFAAQPASGDQQAKIVFVGNAGVMSGPQGVEIINLTIETVGEVARLVRTRAAWTGSRMRFEDVTPQDPVILLEGRWDIGFVFGRLTPQGALAWSADWVGQPALPRFVRLILRDRATGADLLGEADFVVRADAPGACGRSNAVVNCLTAALPATANTNPNPNPSQPQKASQ
jgi:Prokaryotic N-terminal methylation motif